VLPLDVGLAFGTMIDPLRLRATQLSDPWSAGTAPVSDGTRAGARNAVAVDQRNIPSGCNQFDRVSE
jgi:hypothetical protein